MTHAQDRLTELGPDDKPHFHFDGFVGDRIQGNVDHWLKRMPADNPGLLDMFSLRDADPHPHLEPWAGEFVGKYLASGALALRMSNDPGLHQTLQQVVNRLIQLQGEDGYLGPWPRDQRLISQWDLWAHYQVINGLLHWHDSTGDLRALESACRAADLICRTFLDSELRIIDAGSPEQNFAIMHGLLMLYRHRNDPQYLQLAEEILVDFEKSGNYVERGLRGDDYYQIEGGRWEALHILQGLAEYYRITGKEDYRNAFLNLWDSINRLDVHNTGAFSTHERAIGTPYERGGIETCCTVAWIAMTIDALRLTADPKIADVLETAVLNAMAGSQHPSGEWWTYTTPMNGRKLPSHNSINFQSKPDTPELNCCSVNGPNSLGSLARWAVMRADREKAVVVNYYGPMKSQLDLSPGHTITVVIESDYPVGGEVQISVRGAEGANFPLWLRVPQWSAKCRLRLNAEDMEAPEAGTYVKIERPWTDQDRVTLQFEMTPRYIEGGGPLTGHVSIFRGPLLLAMDPRFNTHVIEPDPPHGWVHPDRVPVPLVEVSKIPEAELLPSESRLYGAGLYRPWLLLELPAAGQDTLLLCDFATAGFPGTSYLTWLETTP